MEKINGYIELDGRVQRIDSIEDLKQIVNELGKSFTDLTEKEFKELTWRKRSMPTQSKRFNPPTFEVKNGVETAWKTEHCRSFLQKTQKNAPKNGALPFTISEGVSLTIEIA